MDLSFFARSLLPHSVGRSFFIRWVDPSLFGGSLLPHLVNRSCPMWHGESALPHVVARSFPLPSLARSFFVCETALDCPFHVLPYCYFFSCCIAPSMCRIISHFSLLQSTPGCACSMCAETLLRCLAISMISHTPHSRAVLVQRSRLHC